MMDTHCCKRAGKFALGMAAGLAVGAVAGMAIAPSRRELRHITQKAVRCFDEAVDELNDVMGR